ncbi:hypothetical protein ACVWWI_004357 [Bradyrhizobium sp. USDA 3686]|uniref:hypothetical protein n=1 Tax=Bradyrhizobium TaxID=374 RepID=UPI0019594B16|nr:hypothetical protein [Bradyrhizobium canariense]MBM7482332.1 hypothetical protein [Bradyrhizobium canariense]UFW69519.1 hypothetical protein BcanWU425_22485 [Bradyrhizobium canariense]
MAGKWFANRGQIIQAAIAFVALLFGIYVALPQLPVQHGVAGLLKVWPIILFPAITTVSVIWFFNHRLSKKLEQLGSNMSGPAATGDKSVEPLVPTSELSDFRIPDDGVSTESVTLRLGEYWERGPDLSRTRIILSQFIHEPDQPSLVELAFDFGTGAFVHGGTKTKRTSTNRYFLPVAESGLPMEPYSIFKFTFAEDNLNFFGVRVDHINSFDSSARLLIARCRLLRRRPGL